MLIYKALLVYIREHSSQFWQQQKIQAMLILLLVLVIPWEGLIEVMESYYVIITIYYS